MMPGEIAKYGSAIVRFGRQINDKKTRMRGGYKKRGRR